MIAIIDYGMGNIHSVNKALGLYGVKTIVTDKVEDIKSAEKLVLPGVGAFDDAKEELEKRGLIDLLLEQVRSKKPFLGICLGMQLLFDQSEEAKVSKGLGLIKGSVKRFEAKEGRKVPHMGWNQLNHLKHDCPLLRDVQNDAYVYFCHSYYPAPSDQNLVAASTDYGMDFAALVWKENLFGVQFHPEKSQAVGLKIMENFVKVC
ncbi:MAG: imidazole glycerol phosphate synthase subunit HisH [Candidatus Omnitrophica bacterium]|nr:imidazole glycerol phosphate synthase subunit HisH [Candidatus Omnitrophota bacterium]